MKKILNILLFLFLLSCETVPVSERKQLILLPDSYINKQSAKAYQQFLSKANVVSKSNLQNQELQVIAKNIENAMPEIIKLITVTKNIVVGSGNIKKLPSQPHQNEL